MSNKTKGVHGAKPLAAAEQIGPVLDQEALAEREQALVEIARIEAAYGSGRDLVNQMLGQAQAAGAVERISRALGISKLEFVKKNKLYRDIAGMKIPCRTGKLTGTWEEFCSLLGRSVAQVDHDIANLRTFGEEALESMSQMGIGYREMRQLRRLPEDSQTALIEAAKAGDKDELLDLAEQLIARQKAEKDQLAAERDKATKAASNAEDDLAHANARIAETQRRLNEANRHWARATPDEQEAHLKLGISSVVIQIISDITAHGPGVSSLRERMAALITDPGIDRRHDLFIAGKIAEIERELHVLRDEYYIPHDCVGDPRIEAARTLGPAL